MLLGVTKSFLHGERRVRRFALAYPDRPLSVACHQADREIETSAARHHASHTSQTDDLLIEFGFGAGIAARRPTARSFTPLSSIAHFVLAGFRSRSNCYLING